MNNSEEFISLRTFNERTEAELAKAYLEAGGIEVIFRVDYGGWLPFSTTNSGYPCILVRAQDAAEANRLLEEADKSKD